MSTPFFSIAMPAYNATETIATAIGTVLAQSFGDWELVVVDDGSTDDTGSIVSTFAASDPRIVLVTQPNAGCGAARDTAVRASRGRYIVRFDADDELLPEYLESMHDFIEANPDYDIYSCNGWHVYPDGTRLAARRGAFYEQQRSFTLEDMFSAVHIFTVAVYSRELFDRVGGIRPDVYCEDIDFWLRAFAEGKARHLYTPQYLAIYHMSDTQMTADVETVCASRASVYQHLIDEGALTAEQQVLAEQAIERARQDAWIYTRRTAVTRAVSRVLGPKAGKAVSDAMHRAASVLRPAVARAFSAVTRKKSGS